MLRVRSIRRSRIVEDYFSLTGLSSSADSARDCSANSGIEPRHYIEAITDNDYFVTVIGQTGLSVESYSTDML